MSQHNSIEGTYNDENLSLSERFNLVPKTTRQSLYQNIVDATADDELIFGNGKAVILEYLFEQNLLEKYELCYRFTNETKSKILSILGI